MKTAASIFSWLGAILQTIIDLIILISWKTTAYSNYYSYSNYSSYSTSSTSYPGWVWLLFIIGIIFRIIILIWRQDAVDKGNKVASGICTLLFVSLIGGILTLCIPSEEIVYVRRYSGQGNAAQSTTNNHFKQEQSASEILSQKRYLTSNERTIDKNEQYDFKLIKAYKDLLDDGVITQEEFDKKKAELLEKI